MIARGHGPQPGRVDARGDARGVAAAAPGGARAAHRVGRADARAVAGEARARGVRVCRGPGRAGARRDVAQAAAARIAWHVEGADVGAHGYVSITPAGPAADLVFDDGSDVTLVPGSRGRVAATTATGAEVVLEQGRARVRVKHREKTAWTIDAGPYAVRVTGTELLVAWAADAETLDVWMQSGTASVAGPVVGEGLALAAGQHVTARVREGKRADRCGDSTGGLGAGAVDVRFGDGHGADRLGRSGRAADGAVGSSRCALVAEARRRGRLRTRAARRRRRGNRARLGARPLPDLGLSATPLDTAAGRTCRSARLRGHPRALPRERRGAHGGVPHRARRGGAGPHDGRRPALVRHVPRRGARRARSRATRSGARWSSSRARRDATRRGRWPTAICSASPRARTRRPRATWSNEPRRRRRHVRRRSP